MAAITTCINSGTKIRARSNAWTNPVDASDQDVVPAVLRRVVGAPVTVHAPVAGEQGGDTGGARAGGGRGEEQGDC